MNTPSPRRLRRLVVTVLPAVVVATSALVAHGQSKSSSGQPIANPKVAPAPTPTVQANAQVSAQVPTVAAMKSQVVKPAVVERALAGRGALPSDGSTTTAIVSMNDGQPTSCGDPIRFRARVTGGTRTPGTQVVAFVRISRSSANPFGALATLADIPRRLANGELTQDEVGGTVFVGPAETKEVVFTTEWRACAPLTHDNAAFNVNQDVFVALVIPAQPPGADPVTPRIYGFGIGAVAYRPLP